MSSNDIVARLRSDAEGCFSVSGHYYLADEAADEIERLRGEVERLTLQRDYWARARNEWEKSAGLLEEENKRLTEERDGARKDWSLQSKISNEYAEALIRAEKERDAAIRTLKETK